MTNGGPAFPVPEVVTGNQISAAQYRGLTVRDYFAAAALQGLIASGSPASYAGLGELAYQAADNMLAARE